jgi:cytidine deaminase
MTDIDWGLLRRRAADAAGRAYAPYSGLGVGAAGVTQEGRIVTGCNVENASYGLTLCAECGLVASLHDSGGGRLAAVTVTDRDGSVLAPCGRCRQLLYEAGGAELLVDGARGPRRMSDLLPQAFGAGDLPP